MLDCTFDPVGVVIDWLDACKARRLEDLLNLYDARGSLRCTCGGPCLYRGREDLARYWSTRLERAAPDAFSLTDLAAENDGDKAVVTLDYVAYDGKQFVFAFSSRKRGRLENRLVVLCPKGT